MNRYICLFFAFIVLVLTFSACSSDVSEEKICECEMKPDSIPSLSHEILAELNHLRTSPGIYAEYLKNRRKYYSGRYYYISDTSSIYTEEGIIALNEAIDVLEKTDSMKPLKMNECLYLAALYHVDDIGPMGRCTHDSYNGEKASQRIRRYAACVKMIGECIDYGSTDARDIIISLIVDDGVPSRGHRKLLLEPGFEYVGIASGFHLRYKSMTVIDLFAGKVSGRKYSMLQ